MITVASALAGRRCEACVSSWTTQFLIAGWQDARVPGGARFKRSYANCPYIVGIKVYEEDNDNAVALIKYYAVQMQAGNDIIGYQVNGIDGPAGFDIDLSRNHALQNDIRPLHIPHFNNE